MIINSKLNAVLAYGNDSDEAFRAIRRAAYAENVSQIEVRTERKDEQNKLAAVSSTINTVTDAAKGAQSVASAAGNVKTDQQQRETVPRLQQEFAAGRSETASDAQRLETRQQLLDTPLGDGQTVGSRFNEQQVDVLMGGRVTQSKEELMNMGFSGREADTLIAKGNDADGLTAEDAANFAWDSRKSESTQNSEHFRDTLIATLRDEPGKVVGEMVKSRGQDVADQDKKDKKSAGVIRDQANDLSSTSLSFQRTVGDAQLTALRQGNVPRLPD